MVSKRFTNTFGRFQSHKNPPDTLLFINKNSVQLFDNSIKFSGKAILFTDIFFCKSETDTEFLRSTILFNDLLSISQISVSGCKALFAKIFRDLEAELVLDIDSFQSEILRNLLLHSERERRKRDFIALKKDANLDFAMLLRDLLDVHFISQKNVGFYCGQMDVTPKRLNQATSKIFGKTPKEIIDDRVLLESKRLLAHTHKSIKELTYFPGFEEPTNFIKYFKKHISKTPLEFREEFVSD
jgi:AraC-like DNA-binding protein